MYINKPDMTIKDKGWYENDVLVGSMKDDDEFKNFRRSDIFSCIYKDKLE